MTKLRKSMALVLAIVMIFGFTLSVSAYQDAYPNTHRNTGKNIADLIAVAKTQIGYAELHPSTGEVLDPESQIAGYTKYGDSFGYSTGEWCAYFVSWCARNAGISTSVVPRLGNCAASVEWYKKHSVYRPANSGYVPKAGDIVFFNWSGGATAKHVGIVTGVSGNNVYTIEGNTGPGRGNRCMAKTRKRSAGYIVGYGVPAYNDAGSHKESYSFSDSVKYAKLAVVTTTATEITATNAMLHGSVTNSGRFRISSAGFFFGTDKSKLAKHSVITSTTSPEFHLEMDVASKVGELTPNTTYYYQTYVNIDGKDYLGPMYAVVTVNDKPQQLLLSEISANVGVGQTTVITATTFPYGSVSKGITWVSSDESIATVTNDGTVKGISYGTVKLTATTAYGPVSADCNITVLIPAPENVSLSNKSENSINLKWDAVDGAKGYVIYRNTEMDSEPCKFAEVDASSTEFEDTSVIPGEKYFYRVKTLATEEEYNSDLSSAVYSTAKLSVPENIKSERDGVWIDVTWDEVDGATGYLVYRSTSPDGLYTNIGKAYSNKYIDRTVMSAQMYYYKVVADNGNDRTHSDFSEITSTRAKFVSSSVQNEDTMLSSMKPVPVENNDVRILRSRTDLYVTKF